MEIGRHRGIIANEHIQIQGGPKVFLNFKQRYKIKKLHKIKTVYYAGFIFFLTASFKCDA